MTTKPKPLEEISSSSSEGDDEVDSQRDEDTVFDLPGAKGGSSSTVGRRGSLPFGNFQSNAEQSAY